MKNKILKYSTVFMFISALLMNTNLFSQELDASNYGLSFDFKTVKQNDNTRLLEVTFIGKNTEDRKDKVPVYGADIKFFNIGTDEEVLLGSSKTSKDGVSKLIVPANKIFLTDEDGFINITARYEGTEALEAQESEILVQNLKLELELVEIDSVKTVKVKAFSIDKFGVETPVEELAVNFYVGSLLSKMRIDEGSVVEGEYEFELPTNYNGDPEGNLTIYAIVEENEQFGNVIQNKTINWGRKLAEVNIEDNKLWSEAAPLWMYIVLTILLVGVWANFVYTIFNLFKIKKEGLQLKLEKEQIKEE